MRGSWQNFEISLPVDTATQRLLGRLPALSAAAVSFSLVLLLDGSDRLAALLPWLSALAGTLRLRGLEPAPRRVSYSLVHGWRLELEDGECPVALLPGSHAGRNWLVFSFRSADGRQWLVLRRRDRGDRGADWRRLRVLWRTRRRSLVGAADGCQPACAGDPLRKRRGMCTPGKPSGGQRAVVSPGVRIDPRRTRDSREPVQSVTDAG